MTEWEETEPSFYTEEGFRWNMQLRLWLAMLIVVFVCAVWSIRAGRKLAERQGWIAQTRSIPVDTYGQWVTGERRDCISNGKMGFLNCPEPEKGSGDLLTNPLPERVLSVAFWGSTSGDATTTSLWRCERERDTIRCQLRR